MMKIALLCRSIDWRLGKLDNRNVG